MLASLAQSSTLLSDEEGDEDELDPEEVKRERERAKIRELKKRKISCGLTIPLHSRTAHGVFIRTDLEDESAEVDISFEGDPAHARAHSAPRVALMDVDATNDATLGITKPTRSRRPTSKLLEDNLGSHDSSPRAKGARRKSSAAVIKTGNDREPPDTKGAGGEQSKEPGKPKSETYKQSWSVSEQHLLERLLEEIPEGEKNR